MWRWDNTLVRKGDPGIWVAHWERIVGRIPETSGKRRRGWEWPSLGKKEEHIIRRSATGLFPTHQIHPHFTPHSLWMASEDHSRVGSGFRRAGARLQSCKNEASEVLWARLQSCRSETSDVLKRDFRRLGGKASVMLERGFSCVGMRLQTCMSKASFVWEWGFRRVRVTLQTCRSEASAPLEQGFGSARSKIRLQRRRGSDTRQIWITEAKHYKGSVCV